MDAREPAKARWFGWAAILAASLALGLALTAVGAPGAWLLGALVVGVTAALVRPGAYRVKSPVLMVVQAVIGVQLGAAFRAEVVPELGGHLPAIALMLAVTIGVSLTAGVVLSRVTSLSRETATMGTLPGGAGAMVALTIETGGDAGMVALMQYLRVVLVVLGSSLAASLLSGGHAGAVGVPVSAAAPAWWQYALAPMVALVGLVVARRVRIPAGAFLGPILLSVVASSFGSRPVWPGWAVPVATVLLGLYVGFLFERPALVRAGRLLPVLVLNTLVLIACCAGAGLLFAWTADASPVTGYLSSSPGGLDSIAIIALGTGADVSLVLAVQTVRLLVIVFTGPFLARAVLRLTKKRSPHE
jgi:membrane AbrB-like protein